MALTEHGTGKSLSLNWIIGPRWQSEIRVLSAFFDDSTRASLHNTGKIIKGFGSFCVLCNYPRWAATVKSYLTTFAFNVIWSLR